MNFKIFFPEMVKHDIHEIFKNDYGIEFSSYIDSYVDDYFQTSILFDEFILKIKIDMGTGITHISIENMDKKVVAENNSIILDNYESYNAILIEIWQMMKDLGY